MNRSAVSSALALAVALALPSGALAQSPSPSAANAAKLATQKAKAVTYALRDRSGASLGTITLQRIGTTRTRIRVQLANPAATAPRLTLRTGSDCMEPRIAMAPRSPVLLNPFTGRTSETVVNLPLTSLSSGKYLVHVQDATARAQALDACAHLR